METTPITGLDELDKHLDDLIQDTSLTLNPKLFDDIELQLTESNILPLIPRFLPRLTTILKQYTEDPTAIVDLTIKLLRPVPFEDVFSLAQSEELITALESPAPAANLLGIAILRKAAAAPRHISFLCTHPDLVAAFIRCWLVSPQVEVGHRGSRVLGDLLDIDSAQPPPPPPTRPVDPTTVLSIRREPGHGALWDLLFRNRPMYTLLLDLISGHHPDMLANPPQVSLAQHRLLRLLPRLASIDFPTVSRSDFLPPAPAYPVNGHANGGPEGQGEAVENGQTPPPLRAPQPGEGLLQYAALRLVSRGDFLMHMVLVDFFVTLVALMRVTAPSDLKLATLRAVVGEAVAEDEDLRKALLDLPDRTAEEEAEDLRRWVGEVMPGEEVRVVVR
ncbi:hypothetical protein F5144DRAFT_629365 [Chaetomium tenue]|uniref:Uncharacterized protein n=1 Tax=Chaetomium tenue TaxID=1854479 RepID=A0ACB7P593_9PEZI|nr:hypothetical protein F5144DRAFT_629365 [Chaetomium globosum]